MKHIQNPFKEGETLCGVPVAGVRWSNIACTLGSDCEKCLDKFQKAYEQYKEKKALDETNL